MIQNENDTQVEYTYFQNALFQVSFTSLIVISGSCKYKCVITKVITLHSQIIFHCATFCWECTIRNRCFKWIWRSYYVPVFVLCIVEIFCTVSLLKKTITLNSYVIKA